VRANRSAPACPNRASAIATGPRAGAALLGRRRSKLRTLIRGTTRIAPGLDAACMLGGTLRIAYPTSSLLRRLSPALARAVRGRAVLVLSTSLRSSLRGLRAGDSEAKVRRTFHGERLHRIRGVRWYVVGASPRRLVFLIKSGRVRAVGVADKRLTRGRAAQARFLRAWPLLGRG
jgi:hypothetical protein